MANKVVGNLIVNLAANIASFESSMRKASATSQRNMRAMEKRAKETQKKMKAFGRAVVGAFAVVGGAQAVRGLIRASVEVERLEAALITVTGSAEEASAQFKSLEAFAAKTPFQLTEVVNGFIKLKARGLDPSIAALTAYGNVAGATGKTLDQFIEAVGDAATGEMERLKEFGIVARQQGDSVRFTFQGVTTEVGRNAKEITGFLRGLGETKFAGGIERQANTIGGAISNLQDAVFKIMSSGDTDALKQSIRDLTETLGDPSVQAGIQGLVTSLMTLTSWLAKAAGKVAGLGKSIGEFAAKAATGVGGKVFDNAKEISDELKHTEKRIEAILEILNSVAPLDFKQRSGLESDLLDLTDDAIKLRAALAFATDSGIVKPQESTAGGSGPVGEPPKEIDHKVIKYGSLAETLGMVEHRQSALNELNKEAAALTASVMSAQEQYNAELAHYQAFLSNGLISQETFNRLQEEAKQRLEDSAEGFDILKAAGEEAGRQIQSAFADFFYEMNGDVKNMAKNFIDAMRRMMSQALALQAVQGMFGGTSFGKFLGITAAPAHAALGGFASGPTVVGEHGPELLNLPSMSHVTPNSKLGGTNLTINVHAEGAMSPVQVQRMVIEGTTSALRTYHESVNRGVVMA